MPNTPNIAPYFEQPLEVETLPPEDLAQILAKLLSHLRLTAVVTNKTKNNLPEIQFRLTKE